MNFYKTEECILESNKNINFSGEKNWSFSENMDKYRKFQKVYRSTFQDHPKSYMYVNRDKQKGDTSVFLKNLVFLRLNCIHQVLLTVKLSCPKNASIAEKRDFKVEMQHKEGYKT